MVSFAVGEELYYYSSGIYRGTGCDEVIDHAMIAVGFGKSGSIEYAIVRNTWGSNWGEDGYVRVLLTDDPKGGTC